MDQFKQIVLDFIEKELHYKFNEEDLWGEAISCNTAYYQVSKEFNRAELKRLFACLGNPSKAKNYNFAPLAHKFAISKTQSVAVNTLRKHTYHREDMFEVQAIPGTPYFIAYD